MKRFDDNCNDRGRRKRRRSPSYDDDQRAEDGNWPRGETSNRHDSDIPYYYSYRGRRSSPLYDDYGSMRTPLRSYHSSVSNHIGYRRSSVDDEGEWRSQHRRSASPWDDYAYRPRRMSTPPYSHRNMEPSDEYISTSLRPSWRLDDPTKTRKLLIVDLNGSLLLRSAHSRRPDRNRYDPIQKNLRTVYPRPFLHAFRSYILHEETKKWLDTMVWSSAQPHSVGDMVEKCFQDRRHELKAVWARDTLGLNQHEYNRKTQTLKDLEKPWAKLSGLFSHGNKGHSALSTLLVDDSSLKAALQPWNHLCLKEYVQEMRKLDLSVAQLEISRRRIHKVERPKNFDATTDGITDATEFPKVEEDMGIEESMGDPAVTKITKEVVMIYGKIIGEEKLMKKVVREVVMVEGKMVDERAVPQEVPDADHETSQTRQQKKKKEKRLAKKEAIRKAREDAEKEAELAAQQHAEIEEGEIAPDDPASEAQEREVGLLESEQAVMKYDETLLAVIGVLDHIKYEGNVAGWIRQGGLLNIDQVDTAQVTIIRSESPPVKPSPTKKRKLEEQRATVAVELEHDEPPPSSPVPLPPSSSQVLESPSDNRLSSPSPERDAIQERSRDEILGPSPTLWFERSVVLSHWANRGRRALKELDIEAESGIIPG